MVIRMKNDGDTEEGENSENIENSENNEINNTFPFYQFKSQD